MISETGKPVAYGFQNRYSVKKPIFIDWNQSESESEIRLLAVFEALMVVESTVQLVLGQLPKTKLEMSDPRRYGETGKYRKQKKNNPKPKNRTVVFSDDAIWYVSHIHFRHLQNKKVEKFDYCVVWTVNLYSIWNFSDGLGITNNGSASHL